MENHLDETIAQFNCLTEEVDSIYHQAAVKLGVSDSVLFVLYMLHTHGGERLLYDIYKLSGISKQTINSAVRKLEQEKLVYLEKYDGRSKLVCLTEYGKVRAEQTAGRLLEAERKAFSQWSEEELSIYLSLIRKHNTALREQIAAL